MNVLRALILAMLATGFGHAVAAGDVTIISLGRNSQAALGKAFYGPFNAVTGTHVKAFTYDGSMSFVEDMVKAGKPTWDVVEVQTPDLVRGCEQGLFEKLDYSKIGDRRDFIPGSASDCGVGLFASSIALAYNPDKVKNAPNSWADFWELKKYQGKRGLRRSAKYTLEIALLADGVAPADIYRVLATRQGADRAFNKLDRIKASVQWWQAPAQPSVWLAAGNVVMSAADTFWIDAAQQQGKKLNVNRSASIYDVNSWAIVKGSHNAAESYRFIAFASQPENQKVFSENIAYAPTNVRAIPLLDAETAQKMPTGGGNLNGAFAVDGQFWAHQGKVLEERFEKWAPPIRRQQDEEDDEDYTR